MAEGHIPAKQRNTPKQHPPSKIHPARSATAGAALKNELGRIGLGLRLDKDLKVPQGS